MKTGINREGEKLPKKGEDETEGQSGTKEDKMGAKMKRGGVVGMMWMSYDNL